MIEVHYAKLAKTGLRNESQIEKIFDFFTQFGGLNLC